MAKIELTQNFEQIFHQLESRGYKPTYIAKMIGYTTTTQLNSVLDGTSQLSTKAIVNLIEKLNVNPTYLFLSQGEIFMNEDGESELVALRKELITVQHNHSEAVKTAFELGRINKELQQKYDDLVEITAAAIKHYKSKCGDDENKSETELNKPE
jgi:hypothetical protein